MRKFINTTMQKPANRGLRLFHAFAEGIPPWQKSSLFITPVTVTQQVAQHVAAGAGAQLLAIDAEGNLPAGAWDLLNDADAIIFGSPTYMGSPSWQFKKFADASSKVWFTRGWQDKVFGGFTNSASLNGDKRFR